MNEQNNFRELLINIREKNKLSQQELAEILGVSRQTVARWESGKNKPSASQIYKLCQTFSLDADELFSNAQNNSGVKNNQTEVTISDNTDEKRQRNIGYLILIGCLIVISAVGLIITIIYAVKDTMYDSSSTALIISLPQNTPMIVLSVILFILILILVYIFIFLMRGKRK